MNRQHLRRRRAWRTSTWTKERSRRANAAKAKLRASGDRGEPPMTRFDRWQIKVRDRSTGETSGWVTVRGLRDATRRLAVTFREAR